MKATFRTSSIKITGIMNEAQLEMILIMAEASDSETINDDAGNLLVTTNLEAFAEEWNN